MEPKTWKCKITNFKCQTQFFVRLLTSLSNYVSDTYIFLLLYNRKVIEILNIFCSYLIVITQRWILIQQRLYIFQMLYLLMAKDNSWETQQSPCYFMSFILMKAFRDDKASVFKRPISFVCLSVYTAHSWRKMVDRTMTTHLN